MTKCTVLAFVATVSFGMHLSAAMADEVPNYDVRKRCKADTTAQSIQTEQGVQTVPGVTICLTDEQNARTKLVSQWTQFTPDYRAKCTQMVNDPALQSYVELLTCLEMAKDSKN